MEFPYQGTFLEEIQKHGNSITQPSSLLTHASGFSPSQKESPSQIETISGAKMEAVKYIPVFHGQKDGDLLAVVEISWSRVSDALRVH
jgi:hypothetical protein